jgi:hypothetical protein
VQSNHPLQEDLALLDGLSRSDAFVAKPAAANYPPVAQKSQVCPVYPSPLPSGPCNLPHWVMCPTSRQQPYLQVIAVKIPFLVKVHPLPAVMTVASYRFQVVVALSMAQVVVSKSADSQKTNPKPNLLSEKMKLYYVISVTAAYS